MLTTSEKATLSPRALYEAERAEEKRIREREEDIEDNNQYHAALKAPEDATFVKDRRITNRGRMQHLNGNPENKMSLTDFMFATGAIGASIKEVYETFKDLTHSFGIAKAAAAAPGDPRIHQTELHEFDLARVSPQTQALLDREADIIATRVAALEGIDNHAVRRAEQEKIAALAAEYDMLLHPRIGRYVHSEYRVADVEMKFNPGAEAQRCTHTVCVYRLRPQGVDSLGIRSKVGDVLAQDNPAEVITSGQHLPPALKIS